MGKRIIAAVAEISWRFCDRCGVDEEDDPGEFTPGKIATLEIQRDAVDFQGAPVADGGRSGIILCGCCHGLLFKFLGGGGNG
jgi:hypothetical protein